jgi:hypothetical protein
MVEIKSLTVDVKYADRLEETTPLFYLHFTQGPQNEPGDAGM